MSQIDGALRRLASGPLARLVRVDVSTLLRFGLGSITGALLPMLSILLLHQFLAGVLGAEQGVASRLTQSIGRTATLWVGAALLLATFLATAAVLFYNAVARDRLVRTIELRVMERRSGSHLLRFAPRGVTLFFKLDRNFRSPRAHDPSVDHHVDVVGLHVVEHTLIVRDQEERHVRLLLRQRVDALRK